MDTVTIGVILPGTLPWGLEMKVDVEHHPSMVAEDGMASKWALADMLDEDLNGYCSEVSFRGALLLVVMRGTVELSGRIEAASPAEAKAAKDMLRYFKESAEGLAHVIKDKECWVFTITADLLPLRKADYH